MSAEVIRREVSEGERDSSTFLSMSRFTCWTSTAAPTWSIRHSKPAFSAAAGRPRCPIAALPLSAAGRRRK